MPAPCAYDIPPGTRFRGHAHETVHLCAVLRGGFAESVRKQTVDVTPGDLRLSPAGTHRLDFGARGARCLVLELDPADAPAVGRSTFFTGDRRLRTLAGALGRTLARAGDPAGTVEADALTTELLAQIGRRLDGRVGPPPSWLRRARELLHDAPAPPSVRALAAQVGVHRVHLARVFRDHVGVSVSAYARGLRVERALRLLAESETPLSLVAARAGFADQSHLTRALRATVGRTPGQIRRGAALPPFKTPAAPGR